MLRVYLLSSHALSRYLYSWNSLPRLSLPVVSNRDQLCIHALSLTLALLPGVPVIHIIFAGRDGRVEGKTWCISYHPPTLYPCLSDVSGIINYIFPRGP